MITTDGKIKYDSLQCRHPLQTAELCIKYLDWCYKRYALYREDRFLPIDKDIRDWAIVQYEDVETVYQQLEDLGIPLYGFNLSSSNLDYEKSMKLIKKWLIKNGKEWDISQPEIHIPYELYKKIKSSLLK